MLRIQWLANKQGGQTFGNQQIISKLGNDFVSLIKRHGEEWRTVRVRDSLVEVLSPFMRIRRCGIEPDEGCPCYAIDVDDFNTPEALTWGSTSDCSLYLSDNQYGCPSDSSGHVMGIVVHSASAQTRGDSPSPKNSTCTTFGLQQTGQSSTYSCSLPPD